MRKRIDNQHTHTQTQPLYTYMHIYRLSLREN